MTKDFLCSCERCSRVWDDARVFVCPRCQGGNVGETPVVGKTWWKTHIWLGCSSRCSELLMIRVIVIVYHHYGCNPLDVKPTDHPRRVWLGRTWMALWSIGTTYFTCAHEKDTHRNTKSDIDSIPYVYIQMLYIHMQYKDLGVELDICILYRNIDIHYFVPLYILSPFCYSMVISRRGACQQICQLCGGLCGCWGARGVGEAAWRCGRTLWRRRGGAQEMERKIPKK